MRGRGWRVWGLTTAAALSVAVLTVVLGACGTSSPGEAVRDSGTTVPPAFPARAPARDFGPLLVRRTMVGHLATERLDPLSAAQLDQVVVGPGQLYLAGRSPSPTSPPSRHPFPFNAGAPGGQVHEWLGSYRAPTPAQMVNGHMTPEYTDHLVWLVVDAGVPCTWATSTTRGEDPRETTWSIADAVTGQALSTESWGSSGCAVGGP